MKSPLDWTFFEKECPDDFGYYSVINIINNDGSDGGNWRWINELSKNELNARLLVGKIYPMLWRYDDRWLDKQRF